MEGGWRGSGVRVEGEGLDCFVVRQSVMGERKRREERGRGG